MSTLVDLPGGLDPTLCLVYGASALLLYALLGSLSVSSLPPSYEIVTDKHTQLRHIPTEGGSSLPILSYVGAYHFLHDAAGILQQGYNKVSSNLFLFYSMHANYRLLSQYKGRVFKVALIDRWLVVINGTKLVDELQKMPDDKVSFMEAAADVRTEHLLPESSAEISLVYRVRSHLRA